MHVVNASQEHSPPPPLLCDLLGVGVTEIGVPVADADGVRLGVTLIVGVAVAVAVVLGSGVTVWLVYVFGSNRRTHVVENPSNLAVSFSCKATR